MTGTRFFKHKKDGFCSGLMSLNGYSMKLKQCKYLQYEPEVSKYKIYSIAKTTIENNTIAYIKSNSQPDSSNIKRMDFNQI